MGELERLSVAKDNTRNDRLNKSAFSMGQIIATDAIDRRKVELALTLVAKDVVGLEEGEIASTIKSGIESGQAYPRWGPGEVAGQLAANDNLEPQADLFPILGIDDIEHLPNPEWLVKGVIPRSANVEMFGKPGSGKSFVALDLAYCVSEDREWIGREVKPGPAVYIYAEGKGGIKQRHRAWHQHFGQPKRRELFTIPVPVNFQSDADKLVRTVKSCVPDNPALIVIDTLARCFGDGDENNSRDMRLFIAGIDRIRQEWPDATTLVVHHPGKDLSRGARGHSSLEGALDAVIKVNKVGQQVTLSCEKQKDGEGFEDISLRLRTVRWGEGDHESSCVILPQDEVPDERANEEVSGPEFSNQNDKAAYDALKDCGENGATFTEWQSKSGLSESTFKRARKRLEERNLIESSEGHYKALRGQIEMDLGGSD